jgi:hypothetical protein
MRSVVALLGIAASLIVSAILFAGAYLGASTNPRIFLAISACAIVSGLLGWLLDRALHPLRSELRTISGLLEQLVLDEGRRSSINRELRAIEYQLRENLLTEVREIRRELDSLRRR